MNESKKIALISTLYTQAHGGVYTMLTFMVKLLQELGFCVKIAYYMPYSVAPTLSVPLKKIFQKKPSLLHFKGELNVEEYAIGTFLPELEFKNYYPNQYWKALIAPSSIRLVITGHILSALPFYITKKNFLAWVATPYREDRKARVASFPWHRKCMDALFISHVSAWLEKKLLRAGNIVALSHYTKRAFKKNQRLIQEAIPAPVDTTLFFPDSEKVQPGRICFTGRFLDPRKNVNFLLEVFSIVFKKITYARLYLIGDKITPELSRKLDELNIQQSVDLFDYISAAELILKLQETDVFVIPSYQEGLCISGIEAMACGCPVVSTNCGGPSEYVLNNQNGYLLNNDVELFANKIIAIIQD